MKKNKLRIPLPGVGPWLATGLVCLHATCVVVSGRAADPPPLSREQIEAANDALVAAIQAHDPDTLVGLFTPDGVIDYAPAPPPLTTPDQIKGFFADLFHGYPDFTITDQERWVSGNTAVAVWTTLGNQENEWMGLPPTGVPAVPHQHLNVWDYQGDKIALGTTYMDVQTLLIKAGLAPPALLPSLTPSFALPDPVGTGLDPVATVNEYQQRLNVGDVPGIAALLATDCKFYLAMLDTDMDRPAAVAVHELLLAGLPDLSFDAQRIVDLGGGWAMSEGVFTGTHTGMYFGIPPAGHLVNVRAGCIYHVNGAGLLTDLRIFFDGLTMAAQLGAFSPMAEDDLLAIYGKIAAAVNAQDPDGFVADAGDYYTYFYGPIRQSLNQEQTRASFAGFFTAFPDFSTDEGLVLTGDNLVVVEHTGTGTQQGDFDLGMFGVLPPTGRTMQIPHIDIYEFVGGQVARAASYLDFQTELIQLGVLPMPAELPPLAPSFDPPEPEVARLDPAGGARSLHGGLERA